MLSYKRLHLTGGTWCEHKSDGLQPKGDGLEPTSDGLQPGCVYKYIYIYIVFLSLMSTMFLRSSPSVLRKRSFLTTHKVSNHATAFGTQPWAAATGSTA